MTSGLPRGMYSAAIQQLGDGRAHAALQQHRRRCLADGLQQIEILHVASADLQHVDAVLDERVEHAHVHQFGDDRQSVAPGRVLQQLEPVDALALERVGRGARLERAAAHEPRAARLDAVGGRVHLRRVSTEHGPAIT